MAAVVVCSRTSQILSSGNRALAAIRLEKQQQSTISFSQTQLPLCRKKVRERGISHSLILRLQINRGKGQIKIK